MINQGIRNVWKQKIQELNQLLDDSKNTDYSKDANLSHTISSIRNKKYFAELESIVKYVIY